MAAVGPLVNFFIKNKPIDILFSNLVYDQTLTDIDATESPYFSLLVQKDLGNMNKWLTIPPIAAAAVFTPETGQFAMIDNAGPELLDELAFLEHQCLAFKRGTTHYVNKCAKLFYGSKGLFAQYDPKAKTQSPAYISKMRELATLFLTYVLPGQFWRRYYVLYPLPSKIAARQKLNTELAEIEHEWISLYQQSL